MILYSNSLFPTLANKFPEVRRLFYLELYFLELHSAWHRNDMHIIFFFPFLKERGIGEEEKLKEEEALEENKHISECPHAY